MRSTKKITLVMEGESYKFEIINYHRINDDLDFYEVRLPEWEEDDAELLFIQRNDAEFRKEALRLLNDDPYLIPADSPELIGDGEWMWHWQCNKPVDFRHMVARVERVL